MTDPYDPLDGVDFSALLEGGPAEVPVPDTDVPMVKTSINLPLPLYEALTEEARRAGVGRSTLLRQFAEIQLAQRHGQQILVSLADVQEVIARLAQRAHPAA